MSKGPKQQHRSRVQFAERGASVCAVGALVGFAVTILQPLLDWRREAMKPLTQYLLLGLLLCVPFVFGFLLFGWLVRRKRDE